MNIPLLHHRKSGSGTRVRDSGIHARGNGTRVHDSDIHAHVRGNGIHARLRVHGNGIRVLGRGSDIRDTGILSFLLRCRTFILF